MASIKAFACTCAGAVALALTMFLCNCTGQSGSPVEAACYTNPDHTKLQVWVYPAAGSTQSWVRSVDVQFGGQDFAVPVDALDPAGGSVPLDPSQSPDVVVCTVLSTN